ncbi:RNA polymerase sigma factor SigM [Aquisphaera giovannonii]|uniref:RNA polymerase sigma factor SigM n=1 Tax=Aquisphaera giovannonii TaxID=406548 RepID=A0A5B9WDL5_9BACT|nr:sigma-70 family RNA polymerase sigma factor [Aquisphaera giovannonii]QEH38051.1 RNA polymerase sigma factor SigM [Aquisphaera giovannonii]
MSDQPTNEELVRRARGGDIAAFGSLYDRTVRLVRSVAADAGRDAAEDVTHETFLRAFRTLGSLRDPARFAPWLVGIARLVVLEQRRVRRFEPLPERGPQTAEADAQADDDAEELLRLVARLPEEERLAVRFFFLNQRSIEETARLLNRSRSGTYAVLQRAKGRLARWLEECGVSR